MPEPHSVPFPSREPDPVESATSVWVTAQRDAKAQRRGRYVPASVRHPAKMLPAIARHAITHYTEPGGIVLDPMCGIGTTLVEAVRAGRHAVGVEYELRWARIARANLDLARAHRVPGRGQVIAADARDLPVLVDPDLHGRVSLVLTSPPYGASTHGQVRTGPGQGVAKEHYRYSHDPTNLAHHGLTGLLAGFTQILTGAATLLHPGGHVVVTARPWRQHGELVDLPSAVIEAGQAAGLVPVERCVALLAGLRGQGLVPRASFFQLRNVREARGAGIPLHAVVHEDVLVFRAASSSVGSRELVCSQPEPGGPSRLRAALPPAGTSGGGGERGEAA